MLIFLHYVRYIFRVFVFCDFLWHDKKMKEFIMMSFKLKRVMNFVSDCILRLGHIVCILF